MNTRLKPSGPDIVFEDFDGDLVVLNLQSGEYFGFNEAASAFWTACLSGHAPAALSDLVPHSAAVIAFFKTLQDRGLLIPDAATPQTPSPELAATLAALAEAPTVQAYDDLSDLILADPIHDTDADAGWPHLPDAS